MMQKIQKFGGAMFTPVLLFAFAGIVIGVGTLLTTEAIMGDLASPDSLFYQCWNVVLQGGWTVFNQLPLLFAVALPIGMAKKQNARCCMEALVLYLTSAPCFPSGGRYSVLTSVPRLAARAVWR